MSTCDTCKTRTRECEYSWENILASPSLAFRSQNTRESECELLTSALVVSPIQSFTVVKAPFLQETYDQVRLAKPDDHVGTITYNPLTQISGIDDWSLADDLD